MYVKVSAGQGLAAPYLPPDEDGAFITPKKKAVRSLDKEIEVRDSCFRPNNRFTPRSLPNQATVPLDGGIPTMRNSWNSGCGVSLPACFVFN